MQIDYRKFSAGACFAALLLAGGICAFPAAAGATEYTQFNLVTDDQSFLTGLGFAPATTVDTNLVNPWGISHGPATPFWISDAGKNLSTLYSGVGNKTSLNQVVSGGPTGQVFNGNGGFLAGGPTATTSNFIFATLSGTIQARSGTTGTTSAVEFTAPPGTATYTGLAIGTTGGNTYLYAANFKGGIDVFNSTWAKISLAGSFTDPTLPTGYVPFNTQTLGNSLYVTYTKMNASGLEDVTPGVGIVVEYDLNGNYLRDVVEPGLLDSPWGLDIAPNGFGDYANDLLVGNFGNGMIDVFDPNNFNADGTDKFLGTIKNASGNPIVLPDLWGLSNGPAAGSNPNAVYFAAGIGDEGHGLFGALAPVPEPASLAVLFASLTGLGALRRRRRTAVQLA